MRTSANEKIELLRQSLYANHEYHNFAHSITVGGVMIAKPSQLMVKGKQVIGFVLFQIEQNSYICYRCQSFSKKVIEELLAQESVCIVNCLGRFVKKGKEFLIQIEEIMINAVYCDIPLEEPLRKDE